ncbi:hypothetical protein [Nostoc sp. UHCC 0252]|uniref:hypothetical protein n=1 Tax=Nostoc sp. UHCC 0252 TaxID=3110241 RepID=UPI002B21E2BC|nr:hypothetical protein [Nostoc sp. UHCC 0252]MEA5605764.1 hypothetical protein [Nostoc sp. UHCC 0252]
MAANLEVPYQSKLLSPKPRQLAGVISIVVGGSNCWRIEGERSLSLPQQTAQLLE